MNLIDSRAAIFVAGQPSLLSRVWKWAAGWFVRICAGDEDSVDPAAQSSLREWADMPTHHPVSDE